MEPVEYQHRLQRRYVWYRLLSLHSSVGEAEPFFREVRVAKLPEHLSSLP